MKKAYFFIDDVIWVLRDITREKPASIFDNAFMKMLKDAHDKYGLKTQLNLFYRTDTYYKYDVFTLAEVPDTYKSEWEANSDWLKLAFHALQEFPDYPHLNARYEDTLRIFKDIEKEVFRFAGKDSFSYTVCPHWAPMSKEAVKALADSGVKLLHATDGTSFEYNGDPASLPYGHAARLLNNRQPEARVFARVGCGEDISTSVCAYNHLEPEQAQPLYGNCAASLDKETGIYFKPFGDITLNLYSYDELDGVFAPEMDFDYVGICVHEQYFYADYFVYQPDYADKIMKMCKILTANNYTSVNGDEILN